MRSSGVGVFMVALLLPFCVTSANAQERLVSERAVGLSGSYESLTFGGTGLVQLGFAGLDTVRITSVQQRSMPVTASASLTSTWTVDITALYASGTVQFRESGTNIQRSTRLSGVSDVRVRATGAVIDNVLFATVGINLPTGRTALTSREFSALRILAAPALGIASSSCASALTTGPRRTVARLLAFSSALAAATPVSRSLAKRSAVSAR